MDSKNKLVRILKLIQHLFAGILIFWGAVHGFTYAQVGSDHHLRLVKLPEDLASTDVASNNPFVKDRLIKEAVNQIQRESGNKGSMELDLIIQFIDENDQIVSGRKNLQKLSSPFQSRQWNEIQYTFNSVEQPWSKADSIQLQTYINDFYPEIKRLMGNPFFNTTVNIRKDPTITYGGLYFPSLNEIVLHHPSAEIFCHESIHAFRDDFVMTMSTYEEGITRACEIELFNRLPQYVHPFSENHSYPYDYNYEALNRPSIASLAGNILLNPSLQFLKYQLSSYIWAKPFLEDSSFFRRFNDGLYSRMLLNPFVPPEESELKGLFLGLKDQIEGLPSGIWYAKQYLFNSNAPLGYNLFQKINEFVVNFFNRIPGGYEEPQVGENIHWSLLNYSNVPIASGMQLSSVLGDAILPVSNSLLNYRGMITMIASASINGITISDTSKRAVFPSGERGIFGIVEGESAGLVSIKALDTLMPTLTTGVLNGCFEFPSLENVKGRFRISFVYPDCQQASKIITKDRSKYFVGINRKIPFYFTGAADSLWHNAANWSSGFIPNECSDVVIPGGLSKPCVINLPAICRTLDVWPGAHLKAQRSLLIRF